MAIIRVTRELLEHALDLPEGLSIRAATGDDEEIVEGVEVISFYVEPKDAFTKVIGFDDEVAGEHVVWALQYEEGEHGLQLVSAIQVE